MEISYFEDSDFIKLKNIFKEVYAHNPRMLEKEYFDWQFKENPYSYEPGKHNFIITRQGDKIDGFVGIIPFKLKYKEEIFIAGDVTNWFAKDSGFLLLSEVFKRYDYRTYFAITDRALDLYRRLKVPILEKIPRYLAVVNKQTADFFSITDNELRKKLLLSSNKIDSITNCEGMEEIKSFEDDKTYPFVWKSAEGYRLMEGKYLNWRYVKIPSHAYKVIINASNEFAVFRKEFIKGTDYEVIRILEWNFSSASSGKAIGFIKQNYINKNTLIIDFFSTLQEAGDVLAQYGFFYDETNSRSIPYLFRPLHYSAGINCGIDIPPHRKTRRLNFDKWYITKGWSDIDRFKS